MANDRINNAIERARREASNAALTDAKPKPGARPAGCGRPRIHSKGLSEIEAKWEKILKPDCL